MVQTEPISLERLIITNNDFGDINPSAATGDQMTILVGKLLETTNDKGKTYAGWIYTEEYINEFELQLDGEV